jgi:hypothetical protein
MSFGHRPAASDFVANSRVLDEAAMAIIKSVRIDRNFDVPYVGSCNLAGKIVYIDYELPQHITSKGVRYDIDRYIAMHEVVEMLFEHHLKFSYRDAHQIATQAERALVQSDGLSWTVYSRFCSAWVKKIGNRKSYPNPPPDIDLQPEIDCEDATTLKRMGKTKTAAKQRSARGRRRQRD